MKSVLFICHGNTCRSVIAEYLTRTQYSEMLVAQSAGLWPGTTADCEDAFYTLRLYKIDASAHRPRDVRGIDLKQFDFVVALDKKVAMSLPNLVDVHNLIVWDIDDPYGWDIDRYRQCVTVIAKKVRGLFESF